MAASPGGNGNPLDYWAISGQHGDCSVAGGNWTKESGSESGTEGGDFAGLLDASVIGQGCGGICITLLSVPALIAAWCWPAVLAGMLGPAFAHIDTMGSRRLAHTLSWGMSLAAFASMLVFVAMKTPGKRQSLSPLLRWGPFWGLAVASVLVMVDLTRHIFLDANMFIAQLHMFNPDGSVTFAGRFGQVSAWVGNALLFVCLIWWIIPPGKRQVMSQEGLLGGV